MDNSTSPATSTELLTDALQLIADTTIQGVFFGINFFLYFLCIQMFYNRYRKAPSDEKKKIGFYFFYNSLIIFAAALELGTDTRLIQLTYIDNGGTHGEPDAFENNFWNTFSALKVLLLLPGFIIQIFNPLMQLWRTWVIWAASPFRLIVTISPLFLVIIRFIFDIYHQVILSREPSNLSIATGKVTVAFNVGFTLLITSLLVARMVMVRKSHIQSLGANTDNASQHISIVSIFIESFALNAAWSIAVVISFALETAGDHVSLYQIFNNTADQVTVIAFLLVTYRVLSGYSWTSETEKQLTTVQWNQGHPENSSNETMSMDNAAGIFATGATIGGDRLVN